MSSELNVSSLIMLTSVCSHVLKEFWGKSWRQTGGLWQEVNLWSDVVMLRKVGFVLGAGLCSCTTSTWYMKILGVAVNHLNLSCWLLFGHWKQFIQLNLETNWKCFVVSVLSCYNRDPSYTYMEHYIHKIRKGWLEFNREIVGFTSK